MSVGVPGILEGTFGPHVRSRWISPTEMIPPVGRTRLESTMPLFLPGASLGYFSDVRFNLNCPAKPWASSNKQPFGMNQMDSMYQFITCYKSTLEIIIEAPNIYPATFDANYDVNVGLTQLLPGTEFSDSNYKLSYLQNDPYTKYLVVDKTRRTYSFKLVFDMRDWIVLDRYADILAFGQFTSALTLGALPAFQFNGVLWTVPTFGTGSYGLYGRAKMTFDCFMTRPRITFFNVPGGAVFDETRLKFTLVNSQEEADEVDEINPVETNTDFIEDEPPA